MKIKNNLEKKINSLTQTQLDFLDSGIHYLIDEIKVITQKSGLFKKSFERDIKDWDEQHGNNFFSIWIESDTYINTDGTSGLLVRIGKSKGDDFVTFVIEGILFEESYIEKGFFTDKIDWTDPFKHSSKYYPLKNERILDPFNQFFGFPFDEISWEMGNTELMNVLNNLNPNQYRIGNSKKEIKLIESINQTIYNYLQNIESKIKEEKNQKIKVKSKVKDLISKEFDKDSDGILDIIQGDNLLVEILEKNQSVIVEFDHTIIQKIIRLNKYLTQKRKNLGEIFEILKKIDDDKDLKRFLTTFKQSISNYQSLLIHSLNMVVSINKKELIVYYEIYEFFDEVGVFNSNWENEVSEKLSSIDLKLNSVISSIENLMNSIESMENRITTGLDNLSYVTKSSYQSLQSSVTSELKSIRKGVGLNNLLTGINTFQLNQINN